MGDFNRRAFLGMSASALSLLPQAKAAMAQAACVSGGLPSFLPNRVTVDCASRRNFQIFRKNTTYLGLAGVVSMTFIRGKWGSYEAGNLFLFPWLKPKGQALGRTKDWQSVVPMSATRYTYASPIPDSTLPSDAYFCSFVLQAPATSFIGFAVDMPYSPVESRFAWFSNVAKLADGKGVGIDWTSSNLNQPWFGGSQTIPNTDQCNGSAWRKVVIEGLNQASASVC